MVSKNSIGKVVVTALAAGAFAVAGIGLTSPAFADDGLSGRPSTAQQRPNGNRPQPGGPQGGPAQGARILPGGPGQQGPGGPNANRPALQQPGARPGQAVPNQAQNQDAVRAKGLITASAEVLAITPESVLAGLEQGQTLTQIAAARGQSRAFFLSELVSQIEKDIREGQRLGIPASANLQAQLANMIDEASLGLRGVALSNLF